MSIAYQGFLFVLPIGGTVCGVMWFSCRKRIQQSWLWRAAFCGLVGATIAPTGLRIWDDLVICPAVLTLPVLFDATDFLFGSLFTLMPILFTASLLFIIWFVISHRSHRCENHVV
jgi:hypothetical protein